MDTTGEPRPVDTAEVPTAPGEAGDHPRRRRRWIALAVTILGVAAVVTALVVVADGSDDSDAPPASTAPTAPAPTPSTAPTGGSDTPATTQPGASASATEALEPFLTSAATMDGQLQAAAGLINGSGPQWTAVTDEVAAAVEAADLTPVAEAIPPGLPDDLLGPVVLAYSDLASRRAAMTSFASAGPVGPEGSDLLAELGNGHAAAERFDADLAAVRSRAAASPPVAVAGPTTRAAAELLLLVQYVDEANMGCDSRGGVVVTELPPITWSGDDGGTIGSPPIRFQAALGASGGWTVQLIAC